MKKETQFKVGDKVTWSSQANGFYRKKVGTVVHVLIGNVCPCIIAHQKFPRLEQRFTGVVIPGGGPLRKRVGYLVKANTGRGDMLYLPRPKNLRPYEEKISD